jgi:serine/threonine-protein kinase HipA
MKRLNVWIEINGESIHAGDIEGDSPDNAVFTYDPSYIKSNYPSLSISLPVTSKAYSPDATKNFFEGLLPEGFARKSVAKWIKAAPVLSEAAFICRSSRIIRSQLDFL